MANAIKNFHFDFPHPSLNQNLECMLDHILGVCWWGINQLGTPSKQLLKIDTQKNFFLAVLLLFPTIQTENELTILCYTLTKL